MTTLANIHYGAAANLAELSKIIARAEEDARLLGHHPGTVYLNTPHIRLFERRLEDGSVVIDCTIDAE